MPSNILGGAVAPVQLTTRIPRFPSEYSIRSTTSPVLGTPSSIKSIRAGPPPGGKGAGSHLTRPVTSYVPFTHTVPAGLHVFQVPPPVTALFVPSPDPPGATKVPEPVRVIVELSFACADAMPPALVVSGGTKVWLMISQRTCSAEPCTTGRPTIMHNNTAKDTTAIPEIHFALIFMFVLL